MKTVKYFAALVVLLAALGNFESAFAGDMPIGGNSPAPSSVSTVAAVIATLIPVLKAV